MQQDLKVRIIEIASTLFMNQGYTATSTRQISKILNITQPAIYHHFKNKEALYSAVLTEFAKTVGTSLSEILNKQLSPKETLVAMTVYLQQNHSMNLSLMMHDIKHALSEDAELEVFEIWNRYYFSPFLCFFQSISGDLLPDMAVEVVSRHFLRILSAYISETYQTDTMAFIDVEDMVGIFLRGVTSR